MMIIFYFVLKAHHTRFVVAIAANRPIGIGNGYAPSKQKLLTIYETILNEFLQ